MKIIKGINTSKNTSPALFFQGSFSKCKTGLMLVSFSLSCIVFLIISIFSPPIVSQENYFYPFSSSNETSKTFNFLFNGFFFYHRTVQLDCEFVRHHEGPLPPLKLENHVTKSVFIGQSPEILDENIIENKIIDMKYDQEVIFNQNDRKSNVHTFFLEQQKENHFINLTLIYNCNFTDIAGFNFYYTYGNYNVQFLLDVSKGMLFLLTCSYILSLRNNEDIKNTKFYQLILILELLSCLSLNPFYSIFGFRILNYIIPLFLCAFFYIFRIFSLIILDATHAIESTVYKSYEKFIKIFITFYSLLELNEIYDRFLISYRHRQFKQNIIYHWLMILIHFLYIIFGLMFCFKMLIAQKKVASFHLTWSFNIILFVYGFSLIFSLIVNVILSIFCNELNSITPYTIYQFPLHISVFIYHKIISQHAIELENNYSKHSQSLENDAIETN